MATATSTKTYATGRRKTAVARVWLTAGSGGFNINDRVDDDKTTKRARARKFAYDCRATGRPTRATG